MSEQDLERDAEPTANLVPWLHISIGLLLAVLCLVVGTLLRTAAASTQSGDHFKAYVQLIAGSETLWVFLLLGAAIFLAISSQREPKSQALWQVVAFLLLATSIVFAASALWILWDSLTIDFNSQTQTTHIATLRASDFFQYLPDFFAPLLAIWIVAKPFNSSFNSPTVAPLEGEVPLEESQLESVADTEVAPEA